MATPSKPLHELSLCTGGGGGLLASRWLLGWRTVCYVERDAYAVQVIRARIRDGFLDDAPIWDDCRTFDGFAWRGLVDVITAGFPCQPFSSAGKQQGEEDGRNLWPDVRRIILEVRPRYVFLENVPRLLAPVRRRGAIIRPSYFGRILGDLAEGGYDARWDCLPAAAVGAPHPRDRVWIVAHANSDRSRNRWLQPRQARGEDTAIAGHDGPQEYVADTQDGGQSQRPDFKESERASLLRPYVNGSGLGRPTWWETEPSMGRVVDGMAYWVGQLRTIGNGQVPAVARAAWSLLAEQGVNE